MVENQLTKNFTLAEMRCHDGVHVPWTLLDSAKELAENLQVLRDEIGKPVHIISGYRSPLYNRKIGGAKRSYHLKCMAADIKVKGMAPKEVKALILDLIEEERMKQGGIGLYQRSGTRGFVHYDIRGSRARWTG